ncbi:uncharacterized protein TNCT_379601 [Trichonephila clavata]|uniref:Uncharacterized protein n=1 Tax=Trichonephila clavata TaxID=2740835 RepID=A0A8X6HTY1_TRICU|nr:uncharacterized protein TNCT_379601 [Trichonephila clavata]
MPLLGLISRKGLELPAINSFIMQLPNILVSLRQMCLSKFAIAMVNDPDVKTFTSTHSIHFCIWSSEEIEAFFEEKPAILLNDTHVHEIFSKRLKLSFSNYKYQGDDNYHSLPNKQWEILVGQKLSALPLPDICRKEIAPLIKLVLIESYEWLLNHMTIIKSTTNLQHHFHWTHYNKIDRQKTAKAIIADDNIDITDRFMLACNYCFQEDVLSIWGILDDAQRNFFEDSSFVILQKWVNWAGNGAELDWEEIARYSSCDTFGLPTYLPKLEQGKRLQHLMRFLSGVWINFYDLQFCFSILDPCQQKEIFKKYPLQVLQVFLDWPAQEKLLDAVEFLWPYLSEQNFCDFFKVILFHKRMLDWIGYDFVTLVKKLWEKVPFEFRKFIEKDEIFNALKFILEYEGWRPCSHELRLHFDDYVFMAFHSGSTVFVISEYKKYELSHFMFTLYKIFFLYHRINLRYLNKY